jgi:hypothetical protein
MPGRLFPHQGDGALDGAATDCGVDHHQPRLNPPTAFDSFL